MFDRLQMLSPDPILGLTEAFKKDPNPEKINLGVGEYKDETGETPILQCVKKAEKLIWDKAATKLYLPIDGNPGYNKHVKSLIFGETYCEKHADRIVTVQTPGGTAALRVAAELIVKANSSAKVWLSDPTWPNHRGIFESAGLKTDTYPYYDAKTKGLDFTSLMESLTKIPEGDIVLLHGGCHNPTGVDLNENQWKEIAVLSNQVGWIPLIDFAYQGFAEGIETDALGVRIMGEHVSEMFVASSFSKNFGLYNERVGALTALAKTEKDATKLLANLKRCIRTNYSNPPAHGAAIVQTILDSPELREEWVSEVQTMRQRIAKMRILFVEELKKLGVKRDFSFIEQQKGMFSFSGLSSEHVAILREKYSIYIVNNGRINVAGITENNVHRLCKAIAEVLDECSS